MDAEPSIDDLSPRVAAVVSAFRTAVLAAETALDGLDDVDEICQIFDAAIIATAVLFADEYTVPDDEEIAMLAQRFADAVRRSCVKARARESLQ